MRKTLLQKVLCLILSATTLFGAIGVAAAAATTKRGTNRDTASSLEDMQALVGVSSYAEYLEEHGEPTKVDGLPIISIDLTDLVGGSSAQTPAQSEECLDSMETNAGAWEAFGEENKATSVYLPASGKTTWNFHVPDGAASYYYIRIEYYNCATSESSISAIERKLLIDGAAPFDESSYITLNKNWEFAYLTEKVSTTDKADDYFVTYRHEGDAGYCKVVTEIKNGVMTEKIYTISEDINGNSMLPNVNQTAKWNTYYCQDATGYYQGYFSFYLLNGTHQFTLEAEREPVIIKSIELIPYGYDAGIDANGIDYAAEINLPTYEELKAQYADKNYTAATGGSIIKLEAEFPDYVSDSSVYATNNKSSSATYPSEANAQVYNVIGENSYNTLGQWAAYNFTVNKSGLYKIGMRYLQSTLQGMYICRAIKLSGGDYGLKDGTPAAPCLEAYDAQFNYDKEWQSTFIGDGADVDAFEFYFEKGVEYTLYLECSLGSLKNLIQRVENTLNSVNESYLKILQLTGSSPDENTDYDFIHVMPEVLTNLIIQAGELMKVKDELIELCGTNGSHIATLETVARLLNDMGQNNGYDVAKNLSNLKAYLGTLGTWINDSKKGTLIVDSITVCPADSSESVLPKVKAGFFKSLWFEITSFIYSFFIDYEAMGLTTVPDEDTVSVEVWLATGRDQSNIWRTMIDAENGFTDLTGFGVHLKLVTGGTLLPSILADKGPDVYMGLGAADVINYAIRGAVMSVGSTGDGQAAQEFRESEEKAVFNTTNYIYYNEENNSYEWSDKLDSSKNLSFTSMNFTDVEAGNYVSAATNTLELGGIVYGVPQTMSFAMMFYRMDALAEIGQEVPETWNQLLSLLPTLQSNNMQIGVGYILALDFMLYQKGGSLWKYEDDPLYAGAQIALDTNIAYESFEFVCRLFTDYSFPVSYDASNRFRTGEMPIVIGDYIGTYNTLTVYATEIDGLWEFCPLPGSETGEYDENGKEIINYNSLASVTATIMLHGCENLRAAWSYLQWQTSASVQANYGNKMVALIGPSAKYEAANKNAIRNLSWTASEVAAIEDQMSHMSSIVNYPGSYIKDRYMKFAFLEAVNDGTAPIDALSQYIDTMNSEITRKRQEFNLAYIDNEGFRYEYDAADGRYVRVN